MKHILLIGILPILYLLSTGSYAQPNKHSDTDTLAIGLQDAILMALERNPTVAIQRLDPEVESTQTRELSAVFDPRLSLSATNNKTKVQRFLGSRPDPFEMTSERIDYSASISQALPTGTILSADAVMSGSISSIYSDQYIGTIGITITQSLLQGFGIGYNLALLRQAKIDVEISQLELKAIAEQMTADVEQAYWDLFLAKQEMIIQQQSLELAEQQLSESKERVAVGRLPELELAAVHAEVATRHESMIDAFSRYEQARLHLLYLLNPSGQQAWETIPVTMDRPFIPVDTLDTIDMHEQLAMKYRADLQQAQLNLEKGQLEVTRTRNGLLPQLDLFITMERTTYARSFNQSVPDVNSPFYNVSAGVTFEFPVPNRQKRAQHARSKYSHEQLELSLTNMKRLVQWDVRAAYSEVLRSRQQIEATRVAQDLQEQKLLAEQEKFRVGKSTNFLVLQAQRDFVASQLNEAQSKVAYLNALVNLYQMEGTLLERRGIESFMNEH
ncbi:TolC family protein [candidate division KSB1 bacterium]|nr:TolC family protein [candidate division KSB1 bacterium]